MAQSGNQPCEGPPQPLTQSIEEAQYAMATQFTERLGVTYAAAIFASYGWL